MFVCVFSCSSIDPAALNWPTNEKTSLQPADQSNDPPSSWLDSGIKKRDYALSAQKGFYDDRGGAGVERQQCPASEVQGRNKTQYHQATLLLLHGCLLACLLVLACTEQILTGNAIVLRGETLVIVICILAMQVTSSGWLGLSRPLVWAMYRVHEREGEFENLRRCRARPRVEPHVRATFLTTAGITIFLYCEGAP